LTETKMHSFFETLYFLLFLFSDEQISKPVIVIQSD